jgi:glycosyltransferase involved in cell wall biosynthesis
MKVSVVIPSRGGRQRVPRLLASLAAQDVGDWEAIVVVDGDVDGTADLVADYGHLGVRSIVFPQNRGRSAALTAGFAEATGDVLVRCDDDLELPPTFLSAHLAHHHDPDAPVGVIGLCANVYADTGYAKAYGRPADTRARAAAYAASPIDRWRHWGANVSVTRETYAAVGQYDERYRAYGWEDADWGYRLHAHGVPIVIDPACEALHFGAAPTTLARARRAYLSGAARETFRAIHGAGADPPVVRPATTWNRLVDLAARCVTLRTLPAFAGLADMAATALPQRLGEKAVALTVEAASVAGTARPTDTTTAV